MKIVTVVGARPQFIKAAAVSRALREAGLHEILVHTGQHYDTNMSDVFFDELSLQEPRYNFGIGGGNHGAMTGAMITRIEDVLIAEQPDWLLIYGDTNSTLAGAIAAAKLHVPIAHVEAGLRSFNMRMPEEINRVLADRVSTLLLCPTTLAMDNLRNEGMTRGIEHVGDVMYDIALINAARARSRSTVLTRLGLEENGFVLATCHRAENTDEPGRLREIIGGLRTLSQELPVVLPIHPRLRRLLGEAEVAGLSPIIVCEPLPYLDMLALEQAAQLVVTDSGGVQKEAFFFGVPCVTMRDETEWTETVALGMNVLVGASAEGIITSSRRMITHRPKPPAAFPYGTGKASEAIARLLKRRLA